MISIDGLEISFGGFELFKDVSFLVNANDKIGLVGKNGAGKSTLVKVIAGLQAFDKGQVSVPKDLTIGYLPQQMIMKDDKTVVDETRMAFSELLQLEKDLEHLNRQIETRTDFDSDDYYKLIEKLTAAGERHQMLGGATMQADIESTLKGLGFLQTDFDRPTSEFSGGWRMRIEIAKILLKRPHALLLDEPTNHLDIESIQWLEEFLKNYPGAVLLISHDRAFLDNVTIRTIEISVGRIYDYKVSYSKYVDLRKERRDQQLAAYNNQQKHIETTERFIERFRYKATKSVQVQSRIKQLDKIDRIEVDQEDLAAMHFRFPPAPRSGTIVVEAEGLTKKYDEQTILQDIDLVLERGEKVAFVGRNGEGKTTLSRIIVGELPYNGTLKVGHNVKIGYFAQNQDNLMDENKTVFQTIDHVAVGEIRTKIRSILGAFLFSGEDIDKKVKVLSGGERSRLAMAKLLLEPVNLLVLDEPTNHLDMNSKDILKQALINYDGSLILVSHDRDFLNGLVTKIYEFKNKKIRENIGGIYDFLEKKKISSLRELERKDTANKQRKEADSSSGKQRYEEKKEADRIVRKIANQVATSEKRIAEMEQEIIRIDAFFANPQTESDVNYTALTATLQTLRKQLEAELENWERLIEEQKKMNG